MAEHAHTTPLTHAQSVTQVTPRRTLFGAAALLTLATPARSNAMVTTTIPSPDAELIAMGHEAVHLIADYEASTAAWFATPVGHPDFNRLADLGDIPDARLTEMFDRALDLTATTLEGFIAKARILSHEIRTSNRIAGELQFESPAVELAWSLVNDLLAGSAAA